MIFSLLSEGLNGSLAGAAEAVTQAAEASGEAATSASRGGFGPWFWILYIVCLIALFYFFAIRPNKKREQEREQIKQGIKVGDWVVTAGGLYGKVVNIYADEFMLEFGTNKSITIPVSKDNVLGVKEPGLSNEPVPVEVEDQPKKRKFFG